ncbi:hypothetical protein AB1N83_008255 [Pleurotus pulmonarius]
MTPNFRPRFMSAAHVPSSTERLMNPFYHSQVRLPPYRARYLQRFHPYPRSHASGWARDVGDFDFEWDDFLEMVDAFQRLDINSVPRSNSAYAFPSHAGNEEQVAPHQQDGRRTTDSTTVDIVPVETQVILAVDSVHQSDLHQVIEAVNTVVATPMHKEDNLGASSLETGNAVSHRGPTRGQILHNAKSRKRLRCPAPADVLCISSFQFLVTHPLAAAEIIQKICNKTQI